MNHVKVLDCTLRDGAYLIDKEFGDIVIDGIIAGLISSGIEYIEIGFLQNEGFGKGKTVYLNSTDASKHIPGRRNNSKVCVLADFSRYSIDNLDSHTNTGIDCIRECFFKNERFDAINTCKKIKAKGYEVFVQPVDILGYSDDELLELIRLVNDIKPSCFSIVDTFGSMYQEDLDRLFKLVDDNLFSTCSIGFHSHNNLQLSAALSQEFIRISAGKRNVVIDGTLSGMGRGAGNTPTELIAQYLVSLWNANYDIDVLLDMIGTYIDNIRTRCSWGYNTKFFLAGCYSAHVNNIAFLEKKNSIRYKDIRFILNRIEKDTRKRYDYELLEKVYLELMSSSIDDSDALNKLSEFFKNRSVLVIAPGASINKYEKEINRYVLDKKAIVITLNFILEWLKEDFVFVSSSKRIKLIRSDTSHNYIYTSNIPEDERVHDNIVVSFIRLAERGWDEMDNAMMLCLRLINFLPVKEVGIAGFDGYEYELKDERNFAIQSYELPFSVEDLKSRNESIKKMFDVFCQTKNYSITFITPSRFK